MMIKNGLFLFLFTVTIVSCRREPDMAKPEEAAFVLTDSAGLSLQEYLAADGGYWQFTDAVYTRIYGSIQGNDTVYTLKDSSQEYLDVGIPDGDLPYYRFKFSRVRSAKDEMNLHFSFTGTYPFNQGPDSTYGRVYFNYPLRHILTDADHFRNNILFRDTDYMQVYSMAPDHMWIVCSTREFGFVWEKRQYYKLEKR